MFNQLILTNAGQALLTQLLSGHIIEFTKIKLGKKALPAPADIPSLIDVVLVEKTLNVARSSIINGTQINIGANLMGNTIAEAFSWTEIGIFAKDITAGGAEVLFSYQYATEAIPIPAGGTVVELLLDFIINVGNSENVNITLDSSLVFTTQADLDSALLPINEAIAGLGTSKEAAIVAPASPTTKYYRGDKTWQTLDKSVVGLDKVDNYGIATQLQASSGTASDKYMTPQRTKQAVEAYSIISDGNVILKVGGVQPSPTAGKTIIWIDESN